MRFVFHGGIDILINDILTVVPNLIFMKQGTATEIMAGNIFKITADESTDLYAGANYRYKDAIIPFAGIRYNDLTLGFTYDVNTSALGKLTGGTGSMEISLSFMLNNPENVRIPCPKF